MSSPLNNPPTYTPQLNPQQVKNQCVFLLEQLKHLILSNPQAPITSYGVFLSMNDHIVHAELGGSLPQAISTINALNAQAYQAVSMTESTNHSIN